MHHTEMTVYYFTRRDALALVVLISLVVLVFAGAILPVQMEAREKARRVNCAGNLKQIGLSALLYARDEGGFFPNVNANYPLQTNFEPLQVHYLPGDKIPWTCPSRPDDQMSSTFSAYHYIGSGLRDDNAGATQVSLAYDEHGNHPENNWVNVLFIDGHVEGAKPGTVRNGITFNND